MEQPAVCKEETKRYFKEKRKTKILKINVTFIHLQIHAVIENNGREYWNGTIVIHSSKL